MSDTLLIRKELKDKFLRDLTHGEQLFFLKLARDATTGKGYPVCEDLFHYCYFLMMNERLSGIDSHGGEGFLRFLLVEARRDIKKKIRHYEEKLEQKKLLVPNAAGHRLIEYLLR
jgi:hypothetical protein